MDAKPAPGAMVKSLIMNLIGCFFLAYVFARNNAAWSFVPGMDQMSTGAQIANVAIFTWLGFFVPVDINTMPGKVSRGSYFLLTLAIIL